MTKQTSGIFVLLATALLAGCWGESAKNKTPSHPINSANGENSQKTQREIVAAKVAAFCGDCHAVPLPSSFPKDAWHREIEQGFNFYHESLRTDLTLPTQSEVVRYYRELAPEELKIPEFDNSSPSKLAFSHATVEFPHRASFPAVSHLTWSPFSLNAIEPPSSGAIRFCDMRSGQINELVFGSDSLNIVELAKLSHPAHLEPCDLNGDGVLDFLAAELGSFLPEEHDQGKVVWLKGDSATGTFQPITLKDKLGRVADVSPGDFDNDGDLDIVVAEFGWRKTGRIFWMEQIRSQVSTPQFLTHLLDDRHGAIHVPTVDLNQDGHLDFIVLISQEHEMINAFINRGDGSFQREQIFEAGDPSFGSSGIQIVDMDRDGDLDLLYTNGDTLDGYYLKPYHGVRWLENHGDYPFTPHLLTELPGAFRALACDLDGDKDLDIVACSYIPDSLLETSASGQYDTLIWLEQESPGQFVRHRLEHSSNGHLALEVGDFDRDGDQDLAVGGYSSQKGEKRTWLTIWWSELQPNPPR